MLKPTFSKVDKTWTTVKYLLHNLKNKSIFIMLIGMVI